jgi:hypothetical protein
MTARTGQLGQENREQSDNITQLAFLLRSEKNIVLRLQIQTIGTPYSHRAYIKKTTLYEFFQMKTLFKGIVQRKLRGVE